VETETQYTYFIGLDLGQARDYTAVVVLEHTETYAVPPPKTGRDAFEMVGIGDSTGKPSRPISFTPTAETYHVRYCRRFPLGTPYPEIVRWTSTQVRNIMTRARVGLIIDATGVGRAILDMFRDAQLKVVPVNVTSGQYDNFAKGVWNVPKKDLASATKFLLDKKVLKIEDPTDNTSGDNDLYISSAELIGEIQNFRIKINERTRHESYGAWRENDHDDLVFALFLTCWWCLKRKEKAGKAYMPVIVGEDEGTRLPG
jgi:hypothetical protein